MTRLSRSFKAERADERIEIIDDALIEAIELRPLLLVDPSICSKGAENAGGQWRIDKIIGFIRTASQLQKFFQVLTIK